MGFRRVRATTLLPESLDPDNQFASEMSTFELITTREKVDLERFVVEVPAGRGKLLPLPFDTNYVLGKPSGRSKEILVDPHGGVSRGSLANQSFVFFRAAPTQSNAAIAQAQ